MISSNVSSIFNSANIWFGGSFEFDSNYHVGGRGRGRGRSWEGRKGKGGRGRGGRREKGEEGGEG